MTRSLFRTMLIALFLTALSATPARCDSWFKLSSWSWGKKATPATEVSEEAEPPAPAAPAPGIATVSDADCVDGDGDDGHGSFRARLSELRQEHWERGQQLQNAAMVQPSPCYPAINSSLYPCPRPDVPYEVGQTIITNQAFYPHEMLYAHRYRAIYPPYFYQNKCGLACLPFFPKPCLKGTVVTVKYKTCLPWGYSPPSMATKKCFSNTQFR
jgi:hypothetical protein